MFKTLVYFDVIEVFIYLYEVFNVLLLIQSSVIYLKNIIYYYNFSQKHLEVFLVYVSKDTVNDV